MLVRSVLCRFGVPLELLEGGNDVPTGEDALVGDLASENGEPGLQMPGEIVVPDGVVMGDEVQIGEEAMVADPASELQPQIPDETVIPDGNV